MSEPKKLPDLVWFFVALFVLRVLFTGGVIILVLFGTDVYRSADASLLTPLGTLVVLTIRGVGFWHFIKQRRTAPLWLLAAFLVSVIFSAIDLALVGVERFLHQRDTAVLLIEYGIATFVVWYAFRLRRSGVLTE